MLPLNISVLGDIWIFGKKPQVLKIIKFTHKLPNPVSI
jgi:hypothetical protein